MARRGVDDYLKEQKKRLARLGGGSATKPKPAKTERKVTVSPAGKIRQRSIGVSSSSRQRTHKRGPSNRSR